MPDHISRRLWETIDVGLECESIFLLDSNPEQTNGRVGEGGAVTPSAIYLVLGLRC